MGENTKIQWAHHSWNPWIGCTMVSPGCTNCYAKNETFPRVQRSKGLELWGPKAARHITAEANWKKLAQWNRSAAERGVVERVFPSMCDPFEDRPDLVAPRARYFGIIEQTPNLNHLLLTKRPEDIMRLVPDHWRGRFPSNVWIGTSVENQKYADERIPELVKVPAVVRFLSCEPLLGPVDLSMHLDQLRAATCAAPIECDHGYDCCPVCDANQVHWVIVGGESGAAARPMDVAWARSLVQQCADARVACFVKQMGRWIVGDDAGFRTDHWLFPDGNAWVPGVLSPRGRPAGAHGFSLFDKKGGDIEEWPEDLRVREFPAGVAA